MPEQQYALVHNGAVMADESGVPVVTGFLDAPPRGYQAKYPQGCAWLPVEDRDSVPFNPKLHFREPPTFTVESGRALRVHRVVPIRRG